VPERVARDARQVRAPALFHIQWHDEVFPRDGQLALFDLLGSADKQLIAYAGAHAETRPEAITVWRDFISRHLSLDCAPHYHSLPPHLPRLPATTYRRCMERRAYEDVAAAAAAHSELGHEYEGAVAEGLVERISSEIDRQVDARLEQRGVQPTQAAWANVVMGLGSVGLGIGATAVTLHALSTTGTTPKDTVVLGPFHATVNATTSSVSTAQVILVVLIWVVIAIVNIAYARRRPGGFGRLFAVHHAKPLLR
jgi:hypothetical protein